MRIFKVKESDIEKVKARNIEPIKITKKVNGVFEVEVEEDVNIDEILKPEVPVKESKKEVVKESKKDKKKKK